MREPERRSGEIEGSPILRHPDDMRPSVCAYCRLARTQITRTILLQKRRRFHLSSTTALKKRSNARATIQSLNLWKVRWTALANDLSQRCPIPR
jgi:hypothetical protein